MKKKLAISGVLLSAALLFGCAELRFSPLSSTTSATAASETTSSSVSQQESSTSTSASNPPPVYLGMTIHKDQNVSSQATTFSVEEQRNVVRPASSKQDLDDLVDYPVKTDGEVKYFLEPGEWFYLNIYLSNPYNFEIQSFYLNGLKYTNYMFEDGSDLEKIVLRLQAPDIEGYTTYHIGSMKYLDNHVFKDVEMNSDTTVQVGIPYKTLPTCDSKLEIYTDGVRAHLDVEDPNSLSKDYPIYFYLSDGEKILHREELSVGENDVQVSSLDVNNTYQYGVITAYDEADGQYDHAEWLVKETFKTGAPIEFSYVQSDKEEITFAIRPTSERSLENVRATLYKGMDVVGEIPDLQSNVEYHFSHLLSEAKYRLRVDYEYVVDGVRYYENIEEEVETDGFEAPEASFEVVEKGYDSLTFGFHVLDPDNVFRLREVTLRDEEGIVFRCTERKEQYVIDGLLSDHTYFIKASYEYGLNDGTGLKQKETSSISATTKAHVKPILVETRCSIEANRLSVAYELEGDAMGKVESISIHDGGSRIETIEADAATFEDLQEDHQYEIVVRYSYNLNDGKGDVQESKTFSHKTYTPFDVERAWLSVDGIVEVGDSISFTVFLNNDPKYEVTSLGINGKIVDISPLSSDGVVIASLINDGSFGEGEIEFILEGVYFLNERQEVCYLETNVSCGTCSLFKPMEFLSGRIVDGQGEEKEYYLPGDAIYLELIFQNEGQFEIVGVNDQSLEELDAIVMNPATLYLPIEYDGPVIDSFAVKNVQYLSNGAAKTLNVFQGFNYIVLQNDEPVLLDSPEDFHDLEPFRIYDVTKDIDFLQDPSFQGTSLQGIFNGNGHVLKDFIFNETVSSPEPIGLFPTAEGLIRDVKIQRFLMSARYDTSELPGASAGILVGRGHDLIIRNCDIDGDSKLVAQKSAGEIYLGGIVGYGFMTFTMEDCSISASIEGIDCVAAGLVGRVSTVVSTYWNEFDKAEAIDPTCPTLATIRRCRMDANIFTNGKEAVGFVNIDGDSCCMYTYISDCNNSGKIESSTPDNSISFVMGYSTTLSHCVNLSQSQVNRRLIDSLSNYSGMSLYECIDLFEVSDIKNNLVELKPGLSSGKDYGLSTCFFPYWEYETKKAEDIDFYEDMHFDPDIWHFEVEESGKVRVWFKGEE